MDRQTLIKVERVSRILYNNDTLHTVISMRDGMCILSYQIPRQINFAWKRWRSRDTGYYQLHLPERIELFNDFRLLKKRLLTFIKKETLT